MNISDHLQSCETIHVPLLELFEPVCAQLLREDPLQRVLGAWIYNRLMLLAARIQGCPHKCDRCLRNAGWEVFLMQTMEAWEPMIDASFELIKQLSY